MRILQVLAKHPSGLGGQEIYVLNLTQNLRKFGIKCDILTSNPQKPEYYIEIIQGIRVINIKYLGDIWSINPIFYIIPFLKKNSHLYDIIHVHSYIYFSSIQALIFSKILKIPSILTLHGGGDDRKWKNVPFIENLKVLIKNFTFDKIFGKFILSLPNVITSVSKKVINDMAKNFRIQRKRNFWIPNAVDFDKFKQERKNEKFDLGFIGRLSYIKGFDNFLKIVSEIDKIYPNIRIYVIGDGELKPLLVPAMRLYNIKYNPLIKYEEINRIYQEIKILVISSRFEGFPTTILEAMASKTIVVSSNVGGISDIIIHGKNGYLFDIDHFQDAVDIIHKILVNKENNINIIKNAENLIKEKYNWNRISKMFMLIYKKLI